MGTRPLDILGAGAHIAIRTAIGTHNRTYSPSPYISGHARTLLAAGCTWQQARNLLHHLIQNVPLAANFDEAVALAAGLFPAPHGWNYQPVQYCIGDFLTNRNNQTGAQWAAIGRALGQDQRQNTVCFARLANWNHASILLLAQGFAGGNPNAFTTQHWTTIATLLNFNQAAETVAFARLNGWNNAGIAQLIQTFGGNAHGLSELEWASIASRLAANDHAGTDALAAIAGWAFASIDQLAQNRAAAAGNPNNLTPAQWATLAGLCAADDHAGTTALARINGWSAAGINQLAQAYTAANPNNLTRAEWAATAARVGADRHAETAEFARIAGWNAASVLQTATDFTARNPNLHTAAQWAAQAAAAGVNRHADTASFARMRGRADAAWNHADTLQLIQNRNAAGANPPNFSVAEWLAIAAVLPGGAHANVTTFATTNWAHAAVIALATLFGADNYYQTAADWVAAALRYNGGSWAQYTQTAMQYRGRAWPDQVNIDDGGGAVAWHLEGAADGIVYRRTGTRNPHITLHALGNETPDQWWYPGTFHVVTGGRDGPFEYYRTVYRPRVDGRRVVPVSAAATAIADSFCTALRS